MVNYQMTAAIEKYAERLRGRLGTRFPHIEVRSNTTGDDSIVYVNWPLISPPEISRLYVETTKSFETRDIWLGGEFFLPLDKADRLTPDTAVRNGNVGTAYEQFPFNMPEFYRCLRRSPFEGHTRRTLEYRMSEIRKHMRQSSRNVLRLSEHMGLLLDNAPYALVAANQERFEQLNRIIGELLGQIPAYMISLKDAGKLSGRQQTLQRLSLQKLQRRQLKPPEDQ